MKDTSGPGSKKPFARYVRPFAALRMLPLTAPLASMSSSVTLPKSGTMRNGRLYARATLADAIGGIGSSSSPLLLTPTSEDAGRDAVKNLLPTPRERDWKGGHRGPKAHGGDNLPGAVKNLLPTPAAADDVRGPDYARMNRGGSGGDDLVTMMARLTKGRERDAALLPTPTTQSSTGNGHARNLGKEVKILLPTPNAGGFNDGESVESWEARRDRMIEKHNNGNGMGVPLGMAVKLLPTPTAGPGRNSTAVRQPGAVFQDGTNLHDLAYMTKTQEVDSVWGKYAPAIKRWALIIERDAPHPVDEGGRLSPSLVEWMMGFPKGWVDGFSRTVQLKMLGNSVVPQQVAVAWSMLLERRTQ